MEKNMGQRRFSNFETHFIPKMQLCINEALQVGDLRNEYVFNYFLGRIVFYFGGQMVYVPVNQPGLEQKQEKIRAEFNGSNHKELAHKYRVSVQRIYAILKEGKTS